MIINHKKKKKQQVFCLLLLYYSSDFVLLYSAVLIPSKAPSSVHTTADVFATSVANGQPQIAARPTYAVVSAGRQIMTIHLRTSYTAFGNFIIISFSSLRQKAAFGFHAFVCFNNVIYRCLSPAVSEIRVCSNIFFIGVTIVKDILKVIF